MNVTEATQRRASIRSFLPEAVNDQQIRELLEVAARAPSGGNVQPWKVYVLNGESMTNFRAFISGRRPGQSEYPVYPPNLQEPYRTSRYELGEAMYEKLGIPREDKPARLAHLARNFDFFGAPAAFFCFIERNMGAAQWSDLGMFLQTFMLLAKEAGLDTCPQEAWAIKQESVTSFVKASDELMLFCGMAIGYRDKIAKINELRTERRPFEDWATFVD